MAIKDTLLALEKLQTNDTLTYIGEGMFIPFKCCFKPPVTEVDVSNFENETGFAVPNDYKEFLLNSNGMIFFDSGDFQLFDLETVKLVSNSMNYKKGIYVIGSFLEDYIVINSNEINNYEYLYVGANILFDRFISFGHNFEVFLEHLVMTQIQKYWEWYPNPIYYDFSEK